MKLILFDIDGTLIYHVGQRINVGYPRFKLAIKRVFGLDVDIDTSVNYNGWVDRQITWHNVHMHGIGKKEFDGKFSQIAKELHTITIQQAKEKGRLYAAIDPAVVLAKNVAHNSEYAIGIITGNVKRVALWKLEHAGIHGIFSFGVYGDEADDRISLAKTVFVKAESFFKVVFHPEDIYVIGDAIGDIRCGKAIGARTIIVMTGGHSTKEELLLEKPDLLVDTLEDPRVKKLLGLT